MNLILAALLLIPATRPYIDVPEPQHHAVAKASPNEAKVWRGRSTWYCSSRSTCTRGYGPSDMVAAIDRKDTPWDVGDRVRVSSGDRSVVVRIVDVCACGGRRIIDLSSGAFARLAPLGRGVLTVSVEEDPR